MRISDEFPFRQKSVHTDGSYEVGGLNSRRINRAGEVDVIG